MVETSMRGFISERLKGIIGAGRIFYLNIGNPIVNCFGFFSLRIYILPNFVVMLLDVYQQIYIF